MVKSGEETPWFARLVALFDVHYGVYHGKDASGDFEDMDYKTMALVWWLKVLPTSHVPGGKTYHYTGNVPDSIDVDTIMAPVTLATSPLPARDGGPCFVALPYGKRGMNARLE